MITYSDFSSGSGRETVTIETPHYGVHEVTATGLWMYYPKMERLLYKTAYVLRPAKIVAFAVDKRERVIYAAVKHQTTGFVFAVCAPYYNDDDEPVSGDSLDSEADGSHRRKCPLFILERLSPVSQYPYGDNGAQRTKEWRKDCLRRILRLRTVTDSDKAKARQMLDALNNA